MIKNVLSTLLFLYEATMQPPGGTYISSGALMILSFSFFSFPSVSGSLNPTPFYYVFPNTFTSELTGAFYPWSHGHFDAQNILRTILHSSHQPKQL